MGTNSWYSPPFLGGGGGNACHYLVTYAQLVELINTSGLDVSCVYTLIDFSQGNVGVAPLVMRPVSVNEIGQHVLVNAAKLTPPGGGVDGGVFDMFAWLMGGLSAPVPFENSWTGLYDVVNNRLIELKDNLGNAVYDITGLAISNFDWGNAAIKNCIIRDSDWTQNIGSTVEFENLNVLNSTIDTSAMEAGAFRHTSIKSSTITVNADYTGAFTLNNSEIDDATLTIDGAGDVSLVSTVFAGSSLTVDSAAEGTHVLDDCVIQNTSIVDSSLGDFFAGQSRLSSSTITLDGERSLFVVSTHIDTGSIVTNGVPPDFVQDRIDGCHLNSGGAIEFLCSGALACEIYLSHITTQSSVLFQGTTSGAKLYRSSVSENSLININDAISPFLNGTDPAFVNNRVGTSSILIVDDITGGTGTRIVEGNVVENNSLLNINTVGNNVSTTVKDNLITGNSEAYVTAASATTIFSSSRCMDRSQFNIENDSEVVDCSIEGAGAWNTGGFHHTSSRLRGALVVASAAGNTNRETVDTAGTLN